MTECTYSMLLDYSNYSANAKSIQRSERLDHKGVSIQVATVRHHVPAFHHTKHYSRKLRHDRTASISFASASRHISHSHEARSVVPLRRRSPYRTYREMPPTRTFEGRNVTGPPTLCNTIRIRPTPTLQSVPCPCGSVLCSMRPTIRPSLPTTHNSKNQVMNSTAAPSCHIMTPYRLPCRLPSFLSPPCHSCGSLHH